MVTRTDQDKSRVVKKGVSKAVSAAKGEPRDKSDDSRPAVPSQKTPEQRALSARPEAPQRTAARTPGAAKSTGTVGPAITAPPAPPPEAKKELELPEAITVRELANLMGCSPIELIKALMNAGVMANINQQIDYDTAAIVAEDMGYRVKEQKPPEPEVVEQAAPQPVRRRFYTEEEQKYLRERPPVVTILGHVDHGKTSLLDVIRATNVQAHEAGGITQHIGAYQIQVQGKPITFLDTPGHEAFTAMRARGASVTDIAILVVAADDGVQPQTLEAISHARAAQVPIIVALNKIDLPTANPERVKQQLAENGLVVEDWGGDTICVPVSAKTKVGIDTLLEMILLVAEMADLKANPRAKAQGTVIEGKLDRTRGPSATLLVQEGTLRVGDVLLVGRTYGKIRAMYDHQGKPLKHALPSTPVVVTGLHDVPEAGDKFEVVESERQARELAEQRMLEYQTAAARPVLTLDEIYRRAQEGSVQALNLILKADVQGSIEPIRNSLEKIDVGDLKVKFVHQGVGNVSESDVMLAAASQAIIVGFNVGVEPAAQRLAEAEGVSIRTYAVIYELIDDVQRALSGMLKPEYKEVLQGKAIVREVFNISRVGKVAGVQVTEGKALRNALVRVKRAEAVLHEGRVGSLKRFTEDVREVGAGMECGVTVEGFGAFQVGDILEFYTQELVK
jgi:translation initiation factor IF-2